MRRQITRISVAQTSKVMATLYFVVAVVFAAIYFVAFASTRADAVSPVSPVLVVLFPFVYAIIVWLVMACMLWVYNQVARRIGGVEFESADVGPAT